MSARDPGAAASSGSADAASLIISVSTAREGLVRQAAMAVVYEIEAAHLALERAQGPRIKRLAREMLDDFGEMGGALKAAIADIGYSFVPPRDLDLSFQALLDALCDAPDREFDACYLAHIRSTHSAAIDLFKLYRRSGDDRRLARLCDIELPMLEHHLDVVARLGSRA
jgi:putative membrane protein